MVCALRFFLASPVVVYDPYYKLDVNGYPVYWGKPFSLIDGFAEPSSMHCNGARIILLIELRKSLQQCHSKHCPECADTDLRKLLITCDARNIQCFADCDIYTGDDDRKLALMRCTLLSCSFCHTKRAENHITFSEIAKIAKDM